jgi:hypothetical protein
MKKKYNPLPKKHERTVSFSSPKDSRRGCLCKNRNEYSVKCCDGLLVEQGIGVINAPTPCIPTTLEYFVWPVISSASAGVNREYLNYVDINNVSQSIEYWVQPVTTQPSFNFVVSATKPTSTNLQAVQVANEFLAPYGTCFQLDITLEETKNTSGTIEPGNLWQLPLSMSYKDCCGVEQSLVFNQLGTQRICVTEISEQLTQIKPLPGVFPPLQVRWSPFRASVVTSSYTSYINCQQ